MNFVISSVLKCTETASNRQSADQRSFGQHFLFMSTWNVKPDSLFFPSSVCRVTSTRYEMPIYRLLGCRTATAVPRRTHAVGVFIRSRKQAGTSLHWATANHHNFDVGRKSWNFQFKFVENLRKSFKLTGGCHSIYQMHVVLVCSSPSLPHCQSNEHKIQRQKKNVLECEID